MTRITHPDFDRSLSDKAYDLFGDILLQAETEEMLMEIERDKATGNTSEMDAFFKQHDQKHLLQIQRYFRKQRYKHLFTKTIPKLAQIAAIIIAVVALAGSVAIATSHTVRVHIMKLLYHMEEEYTTLQMVEDESASFDVPAEWQGTSYLSYIPDNYSIFNIQSYADCYVVEYQNTMSNEVTLKFAELGTDIETNVDTQGAVTKEVNINGYVGMLYSKESTHSLFWCNDTKYFLLSVTDSSVHELLSIAKGVKKIN